MIMRSKSFINTSTDRENKPENTVDLSENVNTNSESNKENESKSVEEILDDNSSTKSMVDTFVPKPIPDDIYVGKMLWGKMKSHPWWPCMICISPENTFFMSIKYIDKVHVIYFGEYIERSWINIKYTMPYNGIESYQNLIADLKSKKTAKNVLSQYEVLTSKKKAHDFAINEAEEAYACDLEKRIDDYGIEYLSTESEELEPKKKSFTKRFRKKRPKKESEMANKKKLNKKEEYKTINTDDENIEFEFQRLKTPVFTGHKNQPVCFLCIGKNRTTIYDDVLICGNKCHFIFHDKCIDILHKYIRDEDKKMIQTMNKELCIDCNTGVRRCYICMKTDTSIEPIKQCLQKDCYNYYHISCINKPPLRDYIINYSSTSQNNHNSDKADVSCASHVCRACYIKNPKDVHVSTSYVRCLMCYAAFHRGEWCIPAGSIEISSMFIICPQHLPKSGNFDTYRAPFIDIISPNGEVKLDSHIQICQPKEMKKNNKITTIDLWYDTNNAAKNTKSHGKCNGTDSKVVEKVERHHNVNFCMACGKGGLLICCEKCPVSMHENCYKIDTTVAKYECDHCVEGMYPRYGEILWIKHGNHKWWPGQVIHERNAPANLFKFKKAPGLFCVQFFGDNTYCWTNRKHVYQFETEDLEYHTNKKKSSKQESKNKSKDENEIDEKYSNLLSSDSIELATSKGDIRYRTSIVIASKATYLRDERVSLLFYSTLKPKPYRQIKINQPIGSLRNYNDRGGNGSNDKNMDDVYCNCKPSDVGPCGEFSGCINRSLKCECKPSRCKAGKACENQRFTKRDYPPQEIFRTKRCGWGIRSKGVIKKGEFVNEYVGELITLEEAKKRAQEAFESKIDDHYMMMMDKHRVIDANRAGNLSRFMNHSCDPNLECQFWHVNADYRVGIFALRNIEPNEELTFSYNFTTFEDVETKCFCGASNCNGKLSTKISDTQTNSTALKSQGKDTKYRKSTKSQNHKRKRKYDYKTDNNSDSLSQPLSLTTTNTETLDEKENDVPDQSNQKKSQRKLVSAYRARTKSSNVKDAKNQEIKENNTDNSTQAIEINTTIVNREWDNQCFRCGKQGGLDVYCEHASCPRSYHRLCLDLDRSIVERKTQDKQDTSWLCPWHYCDVCGHESQHFCLDCTSSWCSDEKCWEAADLPLGTTVVNENEGLSSVVTKPPPHVRCTRHQLTINNLPKSIDSPQSKQNSEIDSVTSTTGLTLTTESLISLSNNI